MDSVVTVGEAIRREVAAMGDGVERTIARAGELESMVRAEVEWREAVKGVTLDKLLERRTRLPINASIYIMREILSGLACVHESGVVHRDLSPSNVLIATHGVVKITDFGLARNMNSQVTTATVRGTLGYLSPEQVRGEPASAARKFLDFANQLGNQCFFELLDVLGQVEVDFFNELQVN